MQIILTENIRRLGHLGDKIEVKNGYARNYLIPQQKAVIATAENLVRFEEKRAELEKKAKQELAHAQQRAEKIQDLTLIITAMASDEGKLYGSIGTHEIKEALQKKKIEISKREISLPNGPFHDIGEYVIDILLHSDVTATLKIQVLSEK